MPSVRRQPLRLGMRWIIEATNTSWWSNYGQLRRSTDRRIRHRHAALCLATTVLIVQRDAYPLGSLLFLASITLRTNSSTIPHMRPSIVHSTMATYSGSTIERHIVVAITVPKRSIIERIFSTVLVFI